MRRVPIVAAAVVVVAGGFVVAQNSAPRPILHEELPSRNAASQLSPAAIGRGSGGNPTAIAAGDKMLPKPSLDADKASEPVLGKGGFAADRQTSMRPDENTGPDNTLQYVSVFNPDVLPFKRMSAFDQVGEDYTLHVARTSLTELVVGGTTDPKTRDRFWGDVLVQLKPGVDVPLPSVAPDMRILSYEVKPRIPLRFSKDSADNYYVRSDENTAAGQYRLVFYADANAGYFAPALPPRVLKVRDVIAQTPPELRTTLPENVRADAMVTLRRLGIDAHYDLGVAFNKLVSYFRAFQAGEIAHPSGDIYRDLCDSQTGVCRHRSFAFAITAIALGIPTRYVQNEAHAFVEVWFPERGWQRIDLGGAALHMNVQGADDKTLHRPRGDDPFAKPPEYKNQYTQLDGDIRGLSDQQKADKRKRLDQAPASGGTDSTGAATGTGNGTGSGGTGSGGTSGRGATPDRITPDPTAPVTPHDPKKPTPTLVVTTADTHAYRGDLLRVQGSARAEGKPLADRHVNIYLAPSGHRGEGSLLLGDAVTRADGSFNTELVVPSSIDLARYEIRLATDEDAYYNAALSEPE